MLNKTLLNTLYALLLLPNLTFAQQTLKFENGGGPPGTGPSTTSKVVTLYYGNGGVYAPALTATFSLSNQQYSSIEGVSNMPGVAFGADINDNNNTQAGGMNFYRTLNQFGSSTNAHYSTDGVTPSIDIANDYGITFICFSDALISSNGSNLVANTTNVYFADLTITFNRKVTDPVIHFTGMGGFRNQLGFSAGFELSTPGLSLTRLNGNDVFNVTGNSVSNSAARFGTSSSATSGARGTSGSVRVNGTGISSVTFKVYLKGDGNGGTGSKWSTTSTISGDGVMVSASLVASTIAGNVFDDNDGMTNGVDGTPKRWVQR